MKEYRREYPFFSLCGLNCGLCPRYQTKGKSKCPGCGGEDFHLKHPSCAVITCNRKKDNVEYCFQCSAYPCERFKKPFTSDSFISYSNVISDFEKASTEGLEKYKNDLNEKMDILEFLINNFDDGKRKNFYCMAVNLLGLDDLRGLMNAITEEISKMDISYRNKIDQIKLLIESKASNKNIQLVLRK